MGADEAATFERLRAHRKELFEPEIIKHRGRIFKLMGDGLLAEFGSAVDALECAVALQRELAKRNTGLPTDNRIEVRIGLHVGDVIIEGDDRHGDAVNVAARLQALAEPGGICVTRPVIDHVKQRLPLTFEPRGVERLKNIADPIAVYNVQTDTARVRSNAALWLARLRRRPQHLVKIGLLALVIASGVAVGSLYFHLRPMPPANVAARSIAVLPFANLSGDPALDYFSDGITENVIGGLARSADLHVTARTSTAVYKGKADDVRQIGRELNVRYVLEGSVQKGADKIRIVAQLINARSGDHVWTEKFDRESADPLALQDEVTEHVIASIAGHSGAIQKQDYDEAWGKDTASLEEYDYFLRGHSVFFRWTKEDMAEARRIFQEGLAKFPDSSLMRVKIGWTHYQDWFNGWSATPQEDLRRAYEFAQAGLAQPRAPPLAKWYGHWLLALTTLFYERDAVAAAREAEVTLALSPNDPNVLMELSEVLVWAGKPEQALDWMQQAMRSGYQLWPNDHITLAFAYTQAGRQEAAIKELQACDDCSVFGRNWHLMISCLRLGRMDDARSAAAAIRKERPDFSIAKARADLYFANEAETERELDELRQMGFPEI
jgi:TolB-like protein